MQESNSNISNLLMNKNALGLTVLSFVLLVVSSEKMSLFPVITSLQFCSHCHLFMGVLHTAVSISRLFLLLKALLWI